MKTAPAATNPENSGEKTFRLKDWGRFPVFLAVAVFLLVATWAVNANEGRADPARLGNPAIPILAEKHPPLHSQGRLVAVTGAASAESLGERMFLKPGPWLAVRRDFEVYGWMEREGHGVATGPEWQAVEIPRYDYVQAWSANPHDSGAFHEPSGHENPPLRTEKGTYLASLVRIGRYDFRLNRFTLPVFTPLSLTPEMVDLGGRGRLVGDYVYYQDADPERPKTGDVRFFYQVVPLAPEMTVTGELEGYSVVSAGGVFRLEAGGNHDQLVVAQAAFRREQWWRRSALGVLLAAAFFLALILRRPRRRVAARLFVALFFTAAVFASAVLLEGWSATAASFSPALLAVAWAGKRGPPTG